MIAKNDPDLMQASDELYKVNKDDILRQQARARADAEFWEKVHNARMEKMQEELEKNKEELSKKMRLFLRKIVSFSRGIVSFPRRITKLNV